jgi:signal peptidase I
MTAPQTGARRNPVVVIVIGVVIVAVLNLAAVALVRDSFQGYYIPSEAMIPTLKIGDRALLEKLSYRLHDPRRGDVIVHDAPPATATPEISQLVKRIVGLPGETIEGRNGRIFIDGTPLDETYLDPLVKSRTFGPERIPAGSYFVLGDNRPYSKDSTFYGPIERDTIVGRLFLRYGPPSRFGQL